ncbi:MAG: hypothetical protein D6692_02845 [Planctomycetota bacterium]|nr:MAG: hypothetical protein D6692_02845 [Planctomycetota bacterium]
MSHDRLIMLLGLVVLPCAHMPCRGVPPDQTERALEAQGMLDVLEARLLEQFRDAQDEQERAGLIARLEDFYLDRIRSEPAGSPVRSALIDRAWRVVEAASEDQALELRLTLLVESYLVIERQAALDEVGLLSDADRRDAIATLSTVSARLRSIASLVTVRANRSLRLARGSESEAATERMNTDLRLRSLSNYYAGWSGLMLSLLENRRPDNAVFEAFGWLLVGEGVVPSLENLRDASLEYEHVARAAIGVARAKHQAGDSAMADLWLRRVIESPSVPDEIAVQARYRRIRIAADSGGWDNVLTQLFEHLGTADDREPLPVGEARFLALRALQASRERPSTPAESVARLALDDLVSRGEIGHVLDLRERFGRLPLLSDGFVSKYANALDLLSNAESTGSPVRYIAAAESFESSMKTEDAERFTDQRDDAALKRVYCLVRGGRPAQAADAAAELLEKSRSPQFDEEALWLRVVALDATEDVRRIDQLRSAVLAYLARYPGSERARKLLLRHAGTDVLAADRALDELRDIPDDDPLALEARRVIARLAYREWTARGRRDDASRQGVIAAVMWIWERTDRVPSNDSQTRRADLDLNRIAIDAALATEPRLPAAAGEAIERADAIIRSDPSLAGFGPELTLRRVEWLSSIGRLDEADAEADRLRSAADPKAANADRIILREAFQRLDDGVRNPLIDRIVLQIGSRVADELIPPAPQRLSAQASGVLARVIGVAARVGADRDDARQPLVLTLGSVLLERGSPTPQAARDIAGVAAALGESELEAFAWSALLSASSPDEESWWEARYHTLRLLAAADPARAEAVYEQHKVLHPIGGVAPWAARIDALFAPGGGG